MYRRMMVQNRICEKKDMERKKRSYRRRLKRVTKSVDNEVPYSYRNVKKGVKRRNLKKEQMQEERFTAIERDNRMLLEKMSWIMQHNSIDMHNTSRQFCKSLNYPHRVARLKKINQKNKVMLQRIQKTKPYYDVQKWEQERVVLEKHLEHMGEYPYILNKFDKHGKLRPMTSQSQGSLRRRHLRNIGSSQSRRRPRTSGSTMSMTTDGRFSTPGTRGSSRMTRSRGGMRSSGGGSGTFKSRPGTSESMAYRPSTSDSMAYRPNTAEGRMSTAGSRGTGLGPYEDGLQGTEPPFDGQQQQQQQLLQVPQKPTPSHEVILLEEEITFTVGETERVDVRTTVIEIGMRHPNGSDGCIGLLIRGFIPGDEVTVEYICLIPKIKQMCQEDWAVATLEMVEPVNEDEEEDFNLLGDIDGGTNNNEVVYKRISDVAQTLTEGFNAAVKLARHVATKVSLLQDEEGAYYFNA